MEEIVSEIYGGRKKEKLKEYARDYYKNLKSK